MQHFLKCVQQFYIEAATQIRMHFPISDPIIKMLQVLDPSIGSTFSLPSLVPLASRFSNLVPESQLQQLDTEWRRLSLADLPFDKSDMDPEEFWSKLDDLTDGLGNSQFSNLCQFMHHLMALPHSNADVEHIFSSVNIIKTRLRNRMKTSTLNLLLKV